MLVDFNWNPNNAKIKRILDNGKVEYKWYDREKGINTFTDINGVTRRRHYIRFSGPAYGETRKVEELVNGKFVTIERNAYDEAGRLVRNIDRNGVMTIWERLHGGNVVRTIRDGVVERESVYDAGRLIAARIYGPNGARIVEARNTLDELGISQGTISNEIFDKLVEGNRIGSFFRILQSK
jgi:hypothetical protein